MIWKGVLPSYPYTETTYTGTATSARARLRDAIELPRERRATCKKYLTETKEPEAGALLLAGAHWSLGSRVLRRKGRLPPARSELETVLRLKPDFQPARQDLERLKQTR